MKIFGFLLSLLITLALIIALSLRIKQIPPMGYFLDPFHGVWQNAQGSNVEPEQYLTEEALNEPVSIYYDSLLIPHIFAQNEQDLYYAQGYVQASQRLWQMEFVTHVAAGRISEIVGERALEYDRLQRRKGLGFAAEKSLRLLEENPQGVQMVNAYAAGINAYINSLQYKTLPLEYKLLNYRPEPWTPLKTALLLKYMADDLAGHDDDLENTNALLLLGKERFDFLYPRSLPNVDPVIPSEKQWDFKSAPLDTPRINYTDNEFTTQVLPKPDPANGSNNWALSGSRTQSGHTMLANDPHLGLNLPSIWFALQLHAPGINVMGVTLPGAPGVIIGFNDSIAWGVTNATRDVRDWYKITFNNDLRSEYQFDGRLLKSQPRIEAITVRGNPTPFYDTVMYTHYGPVTYDRSFPADTINNERRNYAMKWTAHDPALELMTFYYLNRARNYEDYQQALTYYAAPAQNFAFASAQGNIAMWVQGKFPNKWKGQGTFLMDGSQPEQEWQGYIPQPQNPHILNPERGFVSSANQVPVDSTYPYYFYDNTYEHFRNRRINQQLASMRQATPEDMMRLQNDNYNLKAADILPLMLDSLDSVQRTETAQEAYEQLQKWDYYNNANAIAPTLFDAWWEQLGDAMWDELSRTDIVLERPTTADMIYLMKNHPDDSIMDVQGTSERETLNDILQSAFTQAVAQLQQWSEEHAQPYTWSNYQGTSIQHLAGLDPLGIFDIRTGGGRNIVNATSSRHGPSWRMVVEMSNPVQAWGVYPGGQSGNPGSFFYDNMVDAWAKGEYYPLHFYNSPIKAGATAWTTVHLNPKASQ